MGRNARLGRAFLIGGRGLGRRTYNPRRMPSRLLAAFLACVLFWTAFAGQEQVGSRVAPLAIEAVDARASLADGSIGDHHLDDQPAQSLGELQSDLPAIALAEADPWHAPPATTSHARPVPASWRSALLDAPLRPPRGPFETDL